ncbi:MAG TPA: hypothetical protein VFG54_11490 [Prolixibacteraceae bacterium]|nr:hypothetical protein [Prolixibacteraceae bacterium]
MEIGMILLATVAATSLMTAFSYLVSEAFRELYKEPLLLQYLMTRFNLGIKDTKKVIAGWTLHYFIGLIFVLLFHFLWKEGFLEITWLTGVIYGAIIGIMGIAGWVVMFILSDYKPCIDFKGYYLQLFVAHMIFALTIVLVYKIML